MSRRSPIEGDGMDEDPLAEPPSKSARKRESEAQQQLGVTLCQLSTEEILSFSLPAPVEQAILDDRRITSRSAKKRHRQFIGKLMREVDPEPLKERLEQIERQSQLANGRLHTIERWRDHLLAEGDPALAQLLQQQPQLDAQQLRQLIRNCHAESKSGKPPKAFRQLFRYLNQAALANLNRPEKTLS
ncbi:MAG: DUF615 domain-containing protein [Gammaproteobacteria bacterium]|nr:DUF615 domain-containing protein [Gammaproteobacteria bacterium]